MTGPARAARLETRRHPLVAEVRHRLADRCGVPEGAGLVVGCSGGADSMALLAVLAAMRRPVIAVHVNHHLRPEAEVDRDAAVVEAACRRLDVPCRLEHVHPADEPGSTAAALLPVLLSPARTSFCTVDTVASTLSPLGAISCAYMCRGVR